VTRATEAFVRGELAGLDDLEVASIVALGASESEVLEARAWVEGDEDIARQFEGPTSGMVAQIVAIARAAADREEEEDYR
jgi:hypothetical protein